MLLSLFALALPLASALSSSMGSLLARPPAAPLNVVVVGAGSISREFALKHFGPATHTRVSGICELDDAKALALAADVGAVQAGAAVSGGQ